jgi:hypothetical protein
MKTIKATGPLAYAFDLDPKECPGLPRGHARVHVVAYQTFEMPMAEFERMQFQMHDANSEEARVIAALVAL